MVKSKAHTHPTFLSPQVQLIWTNRAILNIVLSLVLLNNTFPLQRKTPFKVKRQPSSLKKKIGSVKRKIFGG